WGSRASLASWFVSGRAHSFLLGSRETNVYPEALLRQGLGKDRFPTPRTPPAAQRHEPTRSRGSWQGRGDASGLPARAQKSISVKPLNGYGKPREVRGRRPLFARLFCFLLLGLAPMFRGALGLALLLIVRGEQGMGRGKARIFL